MKTEEQNLLSQWHVADCSEQAAISMFDYETALILAEKKSKLCRDLILLKRQEKEESKL